MHRYFWTLTAILFTIFLAVLLYVATPAKAAGFYVTSGFGWNVDGESTFSFVDEESGLVGTLAIGTPIDSLPGLRAELEGSFRTHEVNVGPLTLEHDTTAFMLNAVYDAHGLALGKLVPFVLVGAGVAHTELTVGGLGLLTVENSGFAFQGGGGFNYALSDSVSLGLRYNYLEAPEIVLFGTELDGGSNHSLLATATVKFN
jgi:opacity protein-like surface antigen